MKVFITGITGFVGSHLAEWLLERGDQVMGVGESGRWKSSAPDALVKSIELSSWDIRHPATENLVDRLGQFQPDVVFHFAGVSIPAKCGVDGPTPMAMDINVAGTHNVLDLVERIPIPPKFVFASTVHVYDRVTRVAPFVTETAKIRPISAYGETKLACEQEISRRLAGGLSACVVRGFHHIGPRQPDGLMLTDWLNQLADPNCTQLRVRSTNSYLDLVDVRDAARAYRLLADSPATGIFNLGSGEISKSGDVLAAILETLDRQPTVIVDSDEERWNAIADITKIGSLGWQPSISYPQTVRSMLTSIHL